MKLIVENFSEYLKPTLYIEPDNQDVINKAKQVTHGMNDETDIARALFNFVRDEISHSFDIGGKFVTLKASDVLKYKEGICYAKSILLASLCRSMGIACGLCYQRLILDDGQADHLVLHGLNALYLKSIDGWIRMDARGNKSGVNAQFSIDSEKLAFNVRTDLGESDIPVVYTNVPDAIIKVYEKVKSVEDLYNNLPVEI